MQRDQLDGLVVLKLVAEKRNFSQAAVALNITPSAISQTIKQLETRIGVTLLARTTRTVTLTEAGERLLALAGPAIDQIISAVSDVGEFGTKPSGLLRLNLPRALYKFYFEDLIASFQKKYPDVAVELYFEDGTSDIVENGFDAGIRLSDILANDMVALKLFGPVKFIIAGSPKYFAKYGRPKHPKDLLNHNCILSRLGVNRLYDQWEFEQKGAEFQVQVKGNLIFNDSTFMRQAAVKGRGLIYSFEQCIQNELNSGKLEIVLEQYAAVSTGFYLYYPKKSQVMPKLRAFIEHVRGI